MKKSWIHTLLMWAVLVAAAPLVAAQTPSVAPVSASPAARTIVLIRHGNYIADSAADARLGPPLSPLGVAQARLVADRLVARYRAFDDYYVSPVQRAKDTAAIIAGDFPGSRFIVVDELEECLPPTRRTEVMADSKPGEAEACKARFDRMFEQYFHPAKGTERTELMVCHGNVIRYLVTRALGVDSAAWLEMSVSHASITQIRVEADGRFKVISVGDVGHMPGNMLTGATGDGEHDLAIPALPTRQ